MNPRIVAAVTAAAFLAPAAVATAAGPSAQSATSGETPATVRAGGVVAQVTATGASLGNGTVRREWSISSGAVQTVALTRGGASWANPGADFVLDVDGAPTSSTQGWALESVTPAQPPAQPGRPGSASGAALLFRYALGESTLAPVGVELDRLVVLHPNDAVFEVTSTLVSHGPSVRVASYSLDQITARNPALPAEVQTFDGGSDWRDDYRVSSQPTGAFDSEGEVVRFGTDAGFFFVSQRRGGVMSRVGRDATGRSYAGVDWARDAFDWGPLMTAPPTYNRQDNPAYPVPVRARVLPALGTLDLGTSYLGVYAGGAQQAAAAFAQDFVGKNESAFPRTVGLNTFHPWGHGDGMSDANLRKQVDAAAGLGVETFMLDDQWQGGAGGESGDWNFDPTRFPDSNHDGVPDFVDYLHHKGLRLGLWMSPLEFNMASQTYAAHPDWACAPVGDATAQVQDDAGLGVWDATNPQFQDYLLGVIDRLVRVDDVREFKFDFMAWVDCASSGGEHDYADYEAAFVDLVHRMQQRHPAVTFELDETNDQRAWPFESAQIGPSWFDNGHLHGSGPVAKVLHDVWSASPWVPTWSLGIGTYDGTLNAPYDGVSGVDFLFPLAMLTHITFWTDLTTLSGPQRAETAWWITWYRKHRDGLGPMVYELTGHDPIDGKSWAAWQPWSGQQGYVFAFRQPGSPDDLNLALQNLQAQTLYRLTNVRTGRVVGVETGAALTHGLTLHLPEASAIVLSVQPVSR